MPSVRTRSKVSDIRLSRFQEFIAGRATTHTMRQSGDCLSKTCRRKLPRRARTLGFWKRCHARAGLDLYSWRREGRMRVTIVLRDQTKNKHHEDKGNRSSLFRRENEDLAADLFRRGALHSVRGLTWRDRYFFRILSS